jgi:DNA-binding transcriptional LysR family regulator
LREATLFYQIYHREKRASPLIRAFIEVLKEQRPKLMHDRSLMRR